MTTNIEGAPMTDAQELKPCPFCGAAACIRCDDYGFGISFYAACSALECQCTLGETWDAAHMPEHKFSNEQDAAAAWNTRVLSIAETITVTDAQDAIADAGNMISVEWRPIEPFVVKHYNGDERPTIKGNGFDGLEVGEDREEAQHFVDWINERLCLPSSAPGESNAR